MGESDPRLERLLGRIARDHWLESLNGGLPQVPRREALPTPGADWRFRMIAIPGGTGAADVVYICLKDAAEAYAWEVAATG